MTFEYGFEGIKKEYQMKFKCLKAVLTGIALSLATLAHGGLIDNGSTTFDDTTNLEWLDTSFTLGQSYATAESNLNTYEGGGWRFATSDEWEMLMASALGDVPFAYGWGADYYEAMKRTVELMGMTTIVTRWPHYKIIAHTYAEDPYYSDSRAFLWTMNGAEGLGYIEGNNWQYTNKHANADVASYFVRGAGTSANITVPEPSILAIFALSLAGIGFARRRRS
ncbi:MAG: hypothetical protein ACI965_001673 [Paraglaciecola sp.]|jgi:hypothetical protein